MLEALVQFRHRRFRRDLSAYVDNVLSERARRRLEAHLDSCQACRQELAELRVTVEALGTLPTVAVPRSFALAAAPIAEVRPRPTARRLEFGLRLATATTAFALALVVIGDFAGLPGGGEEEEEEMPAALAPAAEETPPAVGAPPTVTPAAIEVPPEETPEPPAVGYRELAPTPAAAPGMTITEGEEEPAEKEVMEGARVEEEAEAGAAEAEAVVEEEGGLSREEVVRWLEVGLGAGVGILVVLWALARLQRSIGNRP